MDEDRNERLTRLFKGLSDPARLRILGALAEAPRTGRELSERIGLTPPTISHHMARLVGAGLVRVDVVGDRRAYVLDNSVLRGLSRDADGHDAFAPAGPTGTAAEGGDGEERAKVIRDFFVGDRLKQIPAQRKKRVSVLRHLLGRFAPARDYPEREVNDLLRLAHDDVATLRRELVDYGFMTRRAGVYRVAETLPARGPTVAQEIVGDEHAWLRDLVGRATARALGGEGRGPSATSERLHRSGSLGQRTESEPGRRHEGGDPGRILDSFRFDAAADVDAERSDRRDRGGDVLGLEPAREQ